MEPQIQYAKTSDGVSIAYTVLGSGPMIVSPSNTWGNIHMYKNGIGFNPVLDEITGMGWSILTYDLRGSGSSDRDAIDLSLEGRLRDLEAVVERAAPDRFATFAFVQGSPTAIAYSAANPGRVVCSALLNPFASGRDYYRFVPPLRLSQETLEMAEDEWEFHLATLAHAVAGYSNPEMAQRFLEAFRTGMNRATYVAFRRATAEIDVTHLLAEIQVPTLVILDQTAGVPGNPSLVRGVASMIPGARFIETTVIPQVINEFVREHGLASPLPAHGEREDTSVASGTAIILFADIADSTGLTERLGDAAFREKARALDEALRAAISSNGGQAIDGKLLGDGVLATFGAAREAIACAQEIHGIARSQSSPPRAGEGSALLLHVGIHAGDVIRESNNVYGGAVNIAARVAGEAAAGETLVSATVRDLARTSAGPSAEGFEDRGERELKGVGEPVRVFAVRAAEA
jgi:class 3 adenylate cyclase/pimeloyl-ACP methyl ester carboxylesterase